MYLLRIAFLTIALAALNGVVGAVTLSQDGRGQVLIYPYYAARSGYDTLFSVVNTLPSPKAVKVTFYEGKRGESVFRFNLYLGGHGVWTAAITGGPGGTAILVTDDKSCTSPQLGRNNPVFAPLTPNYGNDGETTDSARTTEGHIEVVEMGEPSEYVVSQVPALTFAQAVTSINGIPPGCFLVAKITAPDGSLWQAGAPGDGLTAPKGGLFGTVSLINLLEGIDFGVDAVALAGFRSVPWHTPPLTAEPSLGDALPRESTTADGDGGIIKSTWNSGAHSPADPVTAVLMANAVINEFVLDAVINASTDWVVAMPTRRFYVRTDSATPPFLKPFGKGGSCDVIFVNQHDRDERTLTGVGLPLAPDDRYISVCWETNAISFNRTQALGASALNAKDGISTSFPSGFVKLEPTNAALPTTGLPIDVSSRRIVDDAGRTYLGLPMIGFAAQKYVNGNLGGVRANYGGNFVHRYERSIQ